MLRIENHVFSCFQGQGRLQFCHAEIYVIAGRQSQPGFSGDQGANRAVDLGDRKDQRVYKMFYNTCDIVYVYVYTHRYNID